MQLVFHNNLRVMFYFHRTYGGKYHFVSGDLRNQTAIEDTCKEITNLYPEGIDILINNAGTCFQAASRKHIVFQYN